MLHLRADNLCLSPSVVHGFFGRTGGISTGIFTSLNCGPGSGDERKSVAENRRRALAALTASENARLLTLYQIHSAEAVLVNDPWEIGKGPQADAMVTNSPGLALGILTADCAPVLLADPEAEVIGAAHAGWKGALAGVIEAAVARMELLGAQRSRICAAIGPCIGRKDYEVGSEMRDRFIAADAANAAFFFPGNRSGHCMFDLPGFALRQLERARITSIERIARCTYAEENNFFSFRRATHRGEKDYGRQLSAILLK